MYFNLASQVVSAAPAATSFTTAVVWQNHDGGGFAVKWQSFVSFAGTVQLLGSFDNGQNYCSMTSMAQTMTAASGCQQFDIVYFGGTHIQLQYKAAGTTGAGNMDVWAVRKGRR